MKTIATYGKTFLLLIALYFAFGVASCLLPDKAIKRHIAESAPALADEGNYPKAIINAEQCQMDNFTDALIMNQIYSIDRTKPVSSAMRMVRMSEKGGDWNQTALLLRTVNGETLEGQHYARYWHGSSFLFRPFFMIMDFLTLRHILFIISSLLIVLLLCAYYPQAGLMKTMALTLGFVTTYGFVTQFSMQFFPVMALTLISSLIVIKHGESINLGLLFFVTGSLTCYFDLLTTPLLTLGIPLAVMLSLDDTGNIKGKLLGTSRYALLWGLGFALTFVTKWALATLVLGDNIFADAIETGLYRMEADEFTRFDAIGKNFGMLNLGIIGIAVGAFVVFNLLRHRRFDYRKSVPFLLVGLMPYVWYLLLANHSYCHWWFTYRLQAIPIVSLFLMLSEDAKIGKSPDFTP